MDNIHVFKEEDEWRISIDNQLLDESREEGLYLDLSRLVTMDDAGLMNPLKGVQYLQDLPCLG